MTVHHAIFTAVNILARTTHEKAQGRQVNFRHTSQKCHGNMGSSPKAIKVNGKIPTECRELWIPGFPREIMKASFLAHFKATKKSVEEKSALNRDHNQHLNSALA